MSDQGLPPDLLGNDSVGNLAPHLPEYKDDPPHATLALALARAVRSGTEDLPDTFTDVTIEVEGRKFRSYRLILSAYSEYFHGMFSSKMKEATEQHVALEGVSAETFDIILKIIFESRNLLTDRNVFDIWHAADMYQMLPVVELCKEFLTKNINFNNCFDIYKNANMLSNKSLVDFSLTFISNNFSELRNLASTKVYFLDLSFDDMLILVRSPKLKTQSEDEVINLVLDWVCEKSSNISQNDQNDHPANCSGNSESESRSKHLHSLLVECRLMVESCSWSCLQEAVTRLAQIQDVDVGETKALLMKCISWKVKGYMKHDNSFIWSSNRQHHINLHAIIMIVTSSAMPRQVSVCHHAFNLSFLFEKKSTARNDKIRGRAIASAVLNDQLFVIIDNSIGTVAPSFDLFCYSLICDLFPIKLSSWSLLNEPEAGMAVVNNKLYIVGDVTKDGVVPVGSVHIHFVRPPKEVKDLTVTTSDSTIVMFGSEVSANEDGITVVQCFDTEKSIHYRMEDIIGSPKHLCALPTLKGTYFLLSNGSLCKLVEDTGKLKASHLCMLWTHKRHLLGAVVMQGRITIMHKEPRNVPWPKTCKMSASGEFLFQLKATFIPGTFENIQYLLAVVPKASYKKKKSLA